jgi:hypothetical protein
MNYLLSACWGMTRQPCGIYSTLQVHIFFTLGNFVFQVRRPVREAEYAPNDNDIPKPTQLQRSSGLRGQLRMGTNRNVSHIAINVLQL